MNPLTQELPEAVEIDGVEYRINTDYRTAIRCLEAMEDRELTGQERAVVVLRLLYPEIPPNLEDAAELAIKFLNCGQESIENETQDTEDRLYSFAQDGQYIYSAIKQTFGIDLEREPNLHWWKFCCLFGDLTPDCFFANMVSLRRKAQTGKLSKEERATWAELRDTLELPHTLTAEEQAANDRFMELLEGK